MTPKINLFHVNEEYLNSSATIKSNQSLHWSEEKCSSIRGNMLITYFVYHEWPMKLLVELLNQRFLFPFKEIVEFFIIFSHLSSKHFLISYYLCVDSAVISKGFCRVWEEILTPDKAGQCVKRDANKTSSLALISPIVLILSAYISYQLRWKYCESCEVDCNRPPIIYFSEIPTPIVHFNALVLKIFNGHRPIVLP